MNYTLLLITEDPRASLAIQETFELQGCQVFVCEHAAALPDTLQEVRPDAIIIAGEGLKTAATKWCQFANAFTDLPVIVCANIDDENDEVNCLNNGAIDYVIQSRGMRVLVARAHAHVRRAQLSRDASLPIAIGDLRLDADTREATFRGESLNLTRTEFDLMNTLMSNAHRVVPRRELIDRVWGTWYGDPHVLETHLSRLRNKVQSAGGPRIGTPVRGVGYRLTETNTYIY